MNTPSPSRRNFLLQSAAAVGASFVRPSIAKEQAQTQAQAQASAPSQTQKPASAHIDTNIYLGTWPFRTFPWASDAEVIANLRKRGVTQAWAGSFAGVLQRDPAQVNARLAATCKQEADLLLPVGSINPLLPNWQDDLRRCAETHGMKLIRLHPNYHGYDLRHAAWLELLEAATTHKLGIQLVAQMEDQRTQHPLVQVKPVDLKPLPDLREQFPKARVMVLNANATMVTTALAGTEGLWLDYAMIEGVTGLEGLAASPLATGLCFGSFAPVFYWEAAHLKRLEAGLTDPQTTQVLQTNAARFLAT